MVKPTIITYPDGDTLAHKVAEWLLAEAEAKLDRFSVALSGICSGATSVSLRMTTRTAISA